jgi:cell division septation protein DedD
MQESAKASAVVARPAAPAASGAGWTVQLGSFASRANAERLVSDLKAKGFAAFSTESGSGGRKLYRVRVGPAGDRASAEALGAKLRAAGHPGALTQHP